ncbi:alpha/beta fold hydrolase [Rhodobacterales bacterium HKCCSP123]|nr:alpha/beta fold hydrolase [Rhodobacterales bacterium HKCCSP123]
MLGVLAFTGLSLGSVPAFGQVGLGNPLPLSAETIPCPMSLPAGDIDGETMVCGQIEVPENWDDPGDRTLLITYAIAKARNEAPFADPILYFEGGPGISALEEIEWLDGNTSRLRQTRDIIFFDQRGIRYSSALECPPEVNSTVNEIVFPEGFDLEALDSTISNITPDSDEDALLEAAEILGPGDDALNCAPYFEEQGIDLSQYSSYSNALDAIALMNALNYPSYNLYGISYGSNHTMEVMRYYDENDSVNFPVIRSVVIDGVVGTWVDWLAVLVAFPNVILDAFEQCEADDACLASYPNIRQRAIDLVEMIAADPLTVGESTTITIDDLRGILRRYAFRNEARVYFPRLIDELERGETELYLRLQDETLPIVSDADLPELSTPFEPIAVEANDIADQMRVLADEVENLAAQSRRLSEAYDRGVPLPQFFADEFANSAEQLPGAVQQQVNLFLVNMRTTSGDREQLLQIVTVFSPSERNLLLSLLSLMDDDDIAELYSILADPLYSERFVSLFSIIQTVIHCNDRVFDLRKTFETLRANDAPQLIPGGAGAVDFGFGARCAAYGLSANPSEPISNSSRFPVLVSNGSLDSNTPAIWGETVFEGLENAQMVTFPSSAHGATRDTNCARDITNAFFMYPEEELNLSCVDDLRPVFVLPDDPLPE